MRISSRWAPWCHWLVVLPLLLALAGCKTDLFTKQTEADANDMVAALLENGLPAGKATTDAGKTWNVQVDEQHVVRAMAVLRAYGLPRDRHVTLGEMFKKEGMISTPTEERVRFIFGVAQQLEATLSQIDGVVTARVQIVLPNNDPLATTTKPASASVFLKYRENANLAGLTTAIKNMVARSVEGLPYENVTITTVAAAPVAPAPPPARSYTWLWVTLLVLFLGLGGAGGWIAWKRPAWLPAGLRRKLPGGDAQPAGALPAAEPAAPAEPAGAAV